MANSAYLFFVAISLVLVGNFVYSYPESYCIRFDTDVKGASNPIIINITQKWAPLGANHLFNVINSKFYAVPSAFFRVVPKFVVQFGISGDPPQNVIWDKPIQDGKIASCTNAKSSREFSFLNRSSTDVEYCWNAIVCHCRSKYSYNSVIY